MQNRIHITTNQIQKAATQSSKMEGLSFAEAKKDKRLIQTLKKHGRAFAVSRER